MSILGVVAVGVNWDTMANETNGGGTPGDAVHVDELGNSSYSPAIAAQAPIPTPPAVVFPQAPPLTILPVFRTTLFRSFTPHEWTHLPDGWNPDWASYAECSCVLGGLNYARLYAKPPGWTGPWNPPATKPPAPAAPPAAPNRGRKKGSNSAMCTDLTCPKHGSSGFSEQQRKGAICSSRAAAEVGAPTPAAGSGRSSRSRSTSPVPTETRSRRSVSPALPTPGFTPPKDAVKVAAARARWRLLPNRAAEVSEVHNDYRAEVSEVHKKIIGSVKP